MVFRRINVYWAILIVCGLLIASGGTCEETTAGRLHIINEPKVRSDVKGIVVATHGWLEKGKGQWPEDMAKAIHQRTDANDWICGYFDWGRGATNISATESTRIARQKGGPELAKRIVEVAGDIEHIHLIAHSGGCWLISEAADILAKETKADIHLTFFDAYVPLGWKEADLGDIEITDARKLWIDHYYTKDYTLGWTQNDLTNAHNVDVTKIDQWIKDHNFPWNWYLATITGKYSNSIFLDDAKLETVAGDVEYGFARSKEAGKENWQKSLELSVGEEAVEFEKP